MAVLKELLDWLGVEKVTLLGQDWGGVLALQFTIANSKRVPQQGLLVAPEGVDPKQLILWIRGMQKCCGPLCFWRFWIRGIKKS